LPEKLRLEFTLDGLIHLYDYSITQLNTCQVAP
jgi:hypothetical protein